MLLLVLPPRGANTGGSQEYVSRARVSRRRLFRETAKTVVNRHNNLAEPSRPPSRTELLSFANGGTPRPCVLACSQFPSSLSPATMRLVSAAGGVLLAVHHVAGFAIRPPTGEVGTFNAPLQRRAALQHPRTATAATRPSWRCAGLRERPGCPRISRRRPWWATQAAGAPSSNRGGMITMCSPPVTAASKDREASTTTNAGGGLRLAVVGENADELGLRLAERYGLVATSMDELMKGRKGRKTDNVKARAASEWLASGGATAAGCECVRGPDHQRLRVCTRASGHILCIHICTRSLIKKCAWTRGICKSAVALFLPARRYIRFRTTST